MSEQINVAVDAMGGDNAPAEVVKGAVEAVQASKKIKLFLVGNHILGNLHGIEGCTFLYLVADNPESQTIFVSRLSCYIKGDVGIGVEIARRTMEMHAESVDSEHFSSLCQAAF